MRCFAARELLDAISHAKNGGQALHVFARIPSMRAPACFHKHEEWGHLFDQDRYRLRATARRLGIQKVLVHLPGKARQHVDLCGAPLEQAKKEAARE